MKLKRENWTELLVLNARHRSMTTLNSINAGTDHITQERLILSCITSSTSARNIDVWLDNLVSMDKQIASISKSAFFPSPEHSEYKEIYIFSALRDPYSCSYHLKVRLLYSVLPELFKNQTQRSSETTVCLEHCCAYSLRSRRLEVVSERENWRARGTHARGEGAPSRKAPENRFNPHSVSADFSNRSRGSRGKKLPHGAKKLSINSTWAT